MSTTRPEGVAPDGSRIEPDGSWVGQLFTVARGVPARFSVFYGTYQQATATFPAFPAALGFYRQHRHDSCDGARIVNVDRCDGESDGLTDEQREAVELCDCGVLAPAAVVELFDALKGALAK